MKDFLSIKAIEEMKDMKEKTKYIWKYIIKLFVSRQHKQNSKSNDKLKMGI